MVQWVRLCASTAGGVGLIPGWRTKKILQASRYTPTHTHTHKGRISLGPGDVQNLILHPRLLEDWNRVSGRVGQRDSLDLEAKQCGPQCLLETPNMERLEVLARRTGVADHPVLSEFCKAQSPLSYRLIQAEGFSRVGVVFRGVCPRSLPGRGRSPGKKKKKRLSGEERDHWMEKLRGNKQQWPGGGLPRPEEEAS